MIVLHCAKGEGAVYHSAVTKWFKDVCSDDKNLDNQARSGKPKPSSVQMQSVTVSWKRH